MMTAEQFYEADWAKWDGQRDDDDSFWTTVFKFSDAHAAAQLAEKEREIAPICYHCGNVRVYRSAFPGKIAKFGKNPKGTRCPYCDDWLGLCEMRDRAEAAEQRLQEAQAWKESQLKVTPDWQKIGELLNVGLGQSVTENIIPAIMDLRERLRHREAELEQRWIAVGERLPEVGRRVCVSVSHSGYKTRTMGLWTGESWKIASLEKEQGQLAATIEGTITHWQPIPAPPK